MEFYASGQNFKGGWEDVKNSKTYVNQIPPK